MTIKMVTDSACDMTVQQAEHFGIKLQKVPLILQLGDKIFIDDEKLDVSAYTNEMNCYKGIPKTAAPSPEDFMKAYEGEEESIFVTTISSKLSASHNSALLAKKLYLEENPFKFIHVFESFGASAGEALIALKVQESASKGLSNEGIIEAVDSFIKSQRTYFILEKLDNLVKTGRLTPIAAKLASILSVKPIMGNDENGNLRLIDKGRGAKRAIAKLVDIMQKEGTSPIGKTLAITHCNNLKFAEQIKEAAFLKMEFKDVLYLNAGGLVTNYAQEHGVILSF